ncbi:MAG: NAD(+) synthase [Erysipelotrichaceae bacterium]|nr:NAD(+) synthase [Erysipelotrichaceae bacterium]
MKIAIAQMNVYAGQPERNFNIMKEWIEKAEAAKADLIIFPEMCISGYFLQDKYLDHYFCETLIDYNDRILELSDNIGIIYGNLVYQEIANVKKGRDGRPLKSNGAYFCYQRKWVKKTNDELPGLYIKHLNPDYRIFDDSRYFTSGIDLCLKKDLPINSLIAPFIFNINKAEYRIGIEICEDMWSEDYPLDVTKNYLEQGVDMIINISCSPWTIGKETSRDKNIVMHVNNNEHFVPFIYVNNVGMQNNGKTVMVFDGDSTLYDQRGKRQLSLNDEFKEELKIFELEETQLRTKNDHKLLSALTCAIKEFDQQVFAKNVNWIIGLSGGLDSSVNAALLVLALGNKRIIGYNMASRYNSDTTKDNARVLAENLMIKYHQGSIEDIVKATTLTMQKYGYHDSDKGLSLENSQARIRGHLLSSFAACENGVVINNGNKIEIALGYCTLYGDTIGALSPLGDLTKVQLFELAEEINHVFSKQVIPTNLLPEQIDDKMLWAMKPSAELKEDQIDPMKWFYHDYLVSKLLEYPTAKIEDIMQAYLDGSIYQSEIGKWLKYYGLDKPQAFIEDLEWLLKTISLNVFKRIQMPPIVMVSRGSYGNDFREAQLKFLVSDRYLTLRGSILKMSD